MEIPLFPLHTVLYPGGPLPLRIFEQRYLHLISRCLKEESAFGVLLIRSARGTGLGEVHEIGTFARITDWYQGSDGLLGITATGQQRFRLMSSERQDDGLMIGDVEPLPDEPECPLPEEYKPLAQILSSVLDDLGRLYESLEKRYDDAGWVSYRFSEILPISPEQKQSFLESNDPLMRLNEMRKVLDSVKGP